MVVNIILFVSLYMIHPILYFVMRHEGKKKEDMLFGIKIDSEQGKDERVEKIQKSFYKEMNWYGLILGILPFAVFFTKYFSILYTVLIVWFIADMILMEIPYIHANKNLKRLKREAGWSFKEAQMTYIDMEAAKIQEKLIGKAWLVLSCVISTVPFIYYVWLFMEKKTEAAQLISVLSVAVTTYVLVMMAYLIQRRRGTARSTDSKLNQAISRMKKYHWAKAMNTVAFMNALFTVYMAYVLYGGINNMLVFLVITCSYALLTVFALLYAAVVASNVEKKYLLDANIVNSVDDDDYWIYGMFYYNKKDTSVLVDKRVGTGFTFNMAKKSSQIFMGFIALMILALPLSAVWIIADEFVPIQCYVEENQVISRQYKEEYSIKIEDIKSVEMITERPRLRKINGSSLDDLMKGSFESSEYGKMKVCIRPENEYFLLIKTDNIYLLADQEDEDTKAIYEQLKTLVKQEEPRLVK